MEFGEAVRAKRQAAGMSLTDLADRAGVSKAMLSEIETLKKNPTLPVACQISNALDCQISDLLDLPQTETAFETMGPAQRRVLVDPMNGVERHLLAPSMVKHGVQVLELVMPAGASVEYGPDAAGVLEHMTCLSGRVRIRIGSSEAVLSAGESANYAPREAHAFINASEGESRALLVIDSSHKTPAPYAQRQARGQGE